MGEPKSRGKLEIENTTLGAALKDLRQRLAPLSESASLDAQVLLAHLVGKSRTWVLTHPETALDRNQVSELKLALTRLLAGEPLPYILGFQEFYGLEFRVGPEALIPRPETELLVEQALTWLLQNPHRRSAADVGAGTGCIAVSLAVHVPDLHILATDLSRPALELARQNAALHHASRQVSLVQADLLPAGRRSIDLLCANLPYIPSQTLRSLDVYGKEPSLALDGGEDGLEVIRRLAALAPILLAPKGLLLFEIEASQGRAALEMAREFFADAPAQVLPDLAGRDRLLIVRSLMETPDL